MTFQSNQRSSKRSTASASSARNHEDDVFISQLGVAPHSPSKHEFFSPESSGRSNFYTSANSNIQGYSLNQQQTKRTEAFNSSLDYAVNANINTKSTAYDLQQQYEHFHSMYGNQQPNYQPDIFNDDNNNTYNLMPQATNDMVPSLGKHARDQEPKAPMPESQVGNPVASLSLPDNKETSSNFSSLPAANTSARRKLKKTKEMDDEYVPIKSTGNAHGPPSPVTRKKKLGRPRKIHSVTESTANTSTTKAPKAPKDSKPPKATKAIRKKTTSTVNELQEANVAPTTLRKSVKRKAALAALEEIERRSSEIVEEFFEDTSPFPPASAKDGITIVDSDTDIFGPVVVHDKQVHGSYVAAESASQPIVKRRRGYKSIKLIGVEETSQDQPKQKQPLPIEKVIEREKIDFSLQSVGNTQTPSETTGVPSPVLAPPTPAKISLSTPEESFSKQEIDRLLHSKESELATADLKPILQGLLKTLPAEDLAEASTLLPWTDKNSRGTMNKNFASASNIFFWESVEKWQEVLSLGGFEEKTRHESKDISTTEAVPFKDDAYESYWGERLGSARLLRVAKEKKASNRGRGRGRGRGSSQGVSRGCTRARGRAGGRGIGAN